MENSLENITQTLQTSNGNIILKAGAGTGKTYNLTERVISLIINERCRLDQILAMTFTDYAAAEMRERIYNRISHALQHKEELSPELIEHLQREKREFGKNYISTFHSFCSRILQYYPDELSAITINLLPDGLSNETYGEQKSIRLDSGFEILDDYNEAILTLDWQKAFYKRYKDHPGLQNQLRSLKRRDLEDFLGKVASNLSGEDLQKLATLRPSDYLEILKSIKSDLLETVKEKFDGLVKIIEGHPDWFKSQFPLDIETFLGTTEILTSSTKTMRKKFVAKDAKFEVETNIDSITKELVPEYNLTTDLKNYIETTNSNDIIKSRDSEEYNANHEAFWNLTEIAELSLRWSTFMRYQRFKVRKLNFDDIIWLADRLFRENPQVANQLKNRFKYVLVDEFQDTDKRQWEIVKRLSHWADEGNVLLVGDMKQAIYRFRGGDVTMMRVAEKELSQNNGDELTSLELNYSFRSNEAVVEFCNAFFRHCFSDDADDILYEASAQNLNIPSSELSVRGDIPGKISIMGYSADIYDQNVYKVDYEAFFKDEKEQYLEALRIARFLHEIRLGKHAEYEPIREKLISNEKAVGILYRRRKFQHFMEQALDLYKLPYAVSSGRNFFSRQEILDCHNLLAFLLDAHDDITLVGVLRSPFTGLSDAGLLTIRNVMDQSEQKDPAFWPVIKEFDQWRDQLLPTDQLALSEIVPVLNELREDSKYVRVSDLLEKVMRKTNFLNGYLDQPQAEQNVYKLIDIIRDLEQKEQGNLFEIVEFLRTQIDQDSDEKDAELPDTGAIQIMTVHGSKGLEFPMVIVPDLTASLSNGGLQIYTSPSDAYVNDLPLLAYKAEDKYNHEKDEDTQFIFELLKQQNKKRDIAELRRVFYVALTRAQTHILISDTSSYPKVKNAHLSFSGFMNEWLDAEREKYDDLLDFDLLTKEEFQEITDVIAGKSKIENPNAGDSEKQLLNDELLENAMKRAKLVSRNVSQTIHSDADEQTLEQMVTSPWKKVKPDHAGTIVHKILETGVRDEDQQDILIKNLFRQNGYSIGDDDIQVDLQRIKQEAAKARNWLNERFSHPQKILHEQAFECRLELDGEEQYVRGIIDLLVQDQNGEWHLIDFKTNAVKDEQFAELAKLAGYDRQLRIYQKAASLISNGEIEIPDYNTGLLFTTGEIPAWITLEKMTADDRPPST